MPEIFLPFLFPHLWLNILKIWNKNFKLTKKFLIACIFIINYVIKVLTFLQNFRFEIIKRHLFSHAVINNVYTVCVVCLNSHEDNFRDEIGDIIIWHW